MKHGLERGIFAVKGALAMKSQTEKVQTPLFGALEKNNNKNMQAVSYNKGERNERTKH